MSDLTACLSKVRPTSTSSFPHDEAPHFVYRCYAADGRLLYIGVSYQPVKRMEQHAKRSAWFGQVATIRYVVFPDRAYGLEKEREAIRTELPLHNQAHKPVWRSPAEQEADAAAYQGEAALTGVRARKEAALVALRLGASA